MLVGSVTWMLNSIINQEDVPSLLKKGLLVPIPKHGKDSSLKDNNRGITLLPLFYKLLEKVIIEREKSWFAQENVIDKIQSAGKENLSCLHTSLLVQEAVAYNLNRGNSVHGAGLDARKAFDTVWVNGLLYKLHKAGFNCTAWKLIKSSYSEFQCAVLLYGVSGRWFSPLRGVHQGAPLSMLLYVFYMNDLIRELECSNRGIIIVDMNVTSPAHADDVFLLALYKVNMNCLLCIAYAYSVKWRYSFNTDKTIYLLWGEDENPWEVVRFGNDIVGPSHTCEHLGVELCTIYSLVCEMYNKRVGKVNNVINSAKGIGNHIVPTPPLALSKVYWSVGIPKLVYGLDVTPITDECIEILEFAHRQNAKSIQLLPKNVHNPAPLATIGWMSIKGYIAIMKIMFLFRTLCLNFDSVYRKLLVHRIREIQGVSGPVERYTSPVMSIWSYVVQYNFVSDVNNFIVYGQRCMLPEIKRKVKTRVREIELLRWRFTSFLYSDLSIYLDVVKHIKPILWWGFTQKYPQYTRRVSCIVAIMMSSQPKLFQCNFNCICMLCTERSADSPCHVLFQCARLNHVRTIYNHNIVNSMPHAMRDHYNNVSDNEKLSFICAGLPIEFSTVLKAIADFVFNMYKTRKTYYEPP